MRNLPSFMRVIGAISRVTRSEILKDRVLYNVLVIALLMLGVTVLASQLSFIQPHRMILDFGSSAILLASGMISLFLGATLIIKEFDRRTILVALSHPISRAQFLIGKYLGLAQVLFLNWLCLVILMAGLYAWQTADLSGVPALSSPTLIWAFVFIWVESLLIAAIALFFSTFSTVSVSVMLTLGVLVLGHNLSQLSFLATKTDSAFLRGVLETITHVLPNLELYTLKAQLTYGLPLPGAVVASTLMYSVAYLALTLFVAALLIQRKDR